MPGGSHLRGLLPQHDLERALQQVCGGVVGHRAPPIANVHAGGDLVAHIQRPPLPDLDRVHAQPPARRLGAVQYRHVAALAVRQHALVAHLRDKTRPTNDPQ
eukprot:724905-Prorocentrum_minimum.AAC.3